MLADIFIKNAAEALGVNLDKRVTKSLDWVGQNRIRRLHFYILKNDFDDWRFGHTRLLSVEFRKSRGDYRFHGASHRHACHHVKYSFRCNRADEHETRAQTCQTHPGDTIGDIAQDEKLRRK